MLCDNPVRICSLLRTPFTRFLYAQQNEDRGRSNFGLRTTRHLKLQWRTHSIGLWEVRLKRSLLFRVVTLEIKPSTSDAPEQYFL